MKKHMITAALVAVMALGLGTVAGCSQEAPREDVNANVPAGAPPLMPTSHDGRFENLGAAGRAVASASMGLAWSFAPWQP